MSDLSLVLLRLVSVNTELGPLKENECVRKESSMAYSKHNTYQVRTLSHAGGLCPLKVSLPKEGVTQWRKEEENRGKDWIRCRRSGRECSSDCSISVRRELRQGESREAILQSH